MAVLTIDDLKKLKPFFQVLETFRKNPSAKFASLDGGRIQVNKAECLNLLRSRFSSLSGEEFKDDNFLINYLSKQKNQDEILSELPKNQWEELSQQLVTEATPEDYGQQTTNSDQPTPIGESAGTMAGGAGLPFAPSTPSTPFPRGARIIQSTPPEEGPATAKARRLQAAYEQANPATAKINRLEEQAKALNATRPAPAKVEHLQSAATNPGVRFKQGFGSNLRTFGSNAGIFFRNISGKVAGGLGNIAKGVGRGIVGPGLSSVYNKGARAVLGGSNTFSRVSSLARQRAASFKGFTKPSGKSGAKVFAGGLLAMFLFMFVSGMIAGGSTSTGVASPIGGGSATGTSGDLDKKYDFTSFDIFKSGAVDDSLLQKYVDRALATGKVKADEQKNLLPSRARFIRDQAQGAGLNPAIFLGYWESESAFSDYSYPGVRPGMDLGCDPTNKTLTTFEDNVLCAVGKSSVSNSRTAQCAISRNINSAACQAILFQQAEGVKLPIATLKDFLDSYGSKVSDPNNAKSDAIVKQTIADLGLVSAITTPSTPVDPLVNNDYISWIKNNFNVNLDSSFGEEKIKWAYDILNVSIQVAPNFKNLISSKGPIEVIPGGAISLRSPGKINLSNNSTATQNFFKVTLIHELGHSLKGDRTENTLPISNAIARDKDFLTGYAQGSTARNEVCTGVDSHEQLVQADEDFAESITYYINKNINELDFDTLHKCPPKTTVNPYLVPSANNTKIPKYLNHCQLVQSILGGQNCPLSF